MKRHNPFFIVLIVLTIFITVADYTPIFASSPSNADIVKEYCAKHYPKHRVVFLWKYDAKLIEHRANKKVVYVEISKSISTGKRDKRNGMYWGYVCGQYGYKTWYNKKVPAGRFVNSFYIYNPRNNYEDDIVAVVDNKKIR